MKKVSSFAERLTEAIKLGGIRPIDLARLTGFNKGLISGYLKGTHGNTNPRNDKVFKMANALNVSEHWLMGYDVPMEPNKPQSDTSEFMELIKSQMDMLKSQQETIKSQQETIREFLINDKKTKRSLDTYNIHKA
ncbi:MAG: helix-turn-helix domain-containing protein [Chitinispirillales bacterium]|jgi:transcriptional regulator with XRE-family HTH domain|nr:helix-turn-helix domain-containing protein [Chitinispirillales bacterium]